MVALVAVAAVLAFSQLDDEPPAAPDEPPKSLTIYYADGTEMQHERSHLRNRVLAELASEKINIPAGAADRDGLTIYTTIDPRAQAAAEHAAGELVDGALTAIDPRSGAVTAYWAGRGRVDHATGTLQEPGSAFVPFAKVAAAQAGTREPDPQLVANAAKQAGIPGSVDLGDGKGRRTLLADGQAVRPFDLAAAYATLAAHGVHREPYVVERVENASGDPMYRHTDDPRRTSSRAGPSPTGPPMGSRAARR